jgi:hypothetical protein
MSGTPRLHPIDASHGLPLHALARSSFEAWLDLPAALKARPSPPGLVVVADDPESGGPGLVCGFAALCAARDGGTPLLAVVLPLDGEEVRLAAEGEVAPLLAAIAHGAEGGRQEMTATARRRSRPGSLLEDALRELRG